MQAKKTQFCGFVSTLCIIRLRVFRVLILKALKLLTLFPLRVTLHDMDTSNKPIQSVTIRPTFEDKQLMDELGQKLGVSVSQVIRIALRVLAAKEGVIQ